VRAAPDRDGANIGLARRYSTVSVLGPSQGGYLPVRVRRSDFVGPVNVPGLPAEPSPIIWPAGATFPGWVAGRFLTITGTQAVVSRFGATMRNGPANSRPTIGMVKAFASVVITGQTAAEFMPIRVRQADVLNAANPMPAVDAPQPFPVDTLPPEPPPLPSHDTTPGWGFSASLRLAGDKATVGAHGINLREAPRRDARNLGYAPAHTVVIVTGPAQGEYTPIRVDDMLLRPPASSDDDPGVIASARLGLHASADPSISQAEHVEFAALRPGIIKVLSFHSAADIAQLATAHPGASWIVRAFLDFGGRHITPAQFLNDTIHDVSRALNALASKDVVVELHNEPNLVSEGLQQSWQDGGTFAGWWLELLGKYRQALAGVRFIYPGLSPGHAVTGIKQDHIQFIEASRTAVEAADGLGVHLYWSSVYPMPRSLDVLDDLMSRFREKPIWITEASNNKGGTAPAQKAQQYLFFWQELQKRPLVRGVTYFVAAASNPAFAEEVWVGRNLGALLGRR
jgi:hypothetical protein